MAKEGRISATACEKCMQIRKERTWCPTCTAPVVEEENLPVLDMFIDALPAFRTEGHLQAGFDRREVSELMDLHGVEDKAGMWTALRSMESEMRKWLNEARSSKVEEDGRGQRQSLTDHRRER